MAMALSSISNPDYGVSDHLSKLSHDQDAQTAQNAILALGLISAGTNNARVATMLRQLTEYYAREADHMFCVRIAQGWCHMGKGLLMLSPLHSDRLLKSNVAICGLLTTMFSCLDLKNVVMSNPHNLHYLFYSLVLAMRPRMLVTLDENMEQLNVDVRVGKTVDTTAQAGTRKGISGFQQHKTPVLLSHNQRAELVTEEFIPLSPVLEGFIILKKNPAYKPNRD